MRIRLLGMLIGLVWADAARAQIEIFCQPSHNNFLVGEEVAVRVEVRNNTGGELVLAGAQRNVRLGFELTTESGTAVPQRASLPFTAADIIRSGETWIRNIDLQPFYDLRNSGRLKLHAFLEWEGRGFLSAKKFFSLARGPELGKLVAAKGSAAKKVLIKYSLRTVVREEGEILFLCIEDPESQLRLSAANLGTAVRLYPPQLRRDGADHLHVLHQSAPNRFTHSELTETGKLIKQEHFSTDYQMPDMQEVEGHVLVKGRPYLPGEDRRMPLGPDAHR
jgi:hypothetical protein